VKNKLKHNLKNSSNVILKVFIPELNLDWDGLYFYVIDKKNTTLDRLKKKEINNKKDNV
jgi:hypothetical protein